MNNRFLLLVAPVVVFAFSACGEQGRSGPSDPPAADNPPVQAETDTEVGDWTGYVENYAFDDATDVVSVHFDEVDASGVSGQVTFGSRAAYPAPTDPDVGYPAGLNPFEAGMRLPLTGFSYTILDGSIDGERLRFEIDPREIWQDWCELETPVFDDANGAGYSCVPNWGYSSGPTGCSQPDPVTHVDVPVDCGKLALCDDRVCGCDATSCGMELVGGVKFDIHLGGGEAEGSIAGIADGNPTVRLSHD